MSKKTATIKPDDDQFFEAFGLKSAKDLVGQKFIRTGVNELDGILDGGLPTGKVTQLWGPPGGGKTTLSMKAIGLMMSSDKAFNCVYVPCEEGANYGWFGSLGVDMTRLRVMPANKDRLYIMEDIFEKLIPICNSGRVHAVIIDSWDGMSANKEMYDKKKDELRDMTAETVATKASAGSKIWKMLKGNIRANDILFIVISQQRVTNMIMGTKGTSGGNALDHNVDLKIDIKIGDAIKDSSLNRIGHRSLISINKTKLNKNVHQKVDVPYYYGGNTWDNGDAVFQRALHCGLITKKGAWFEYLGKSELFPNRMLQGEQNVRKEWFVLDEQLKALTSEMDDMNADKVASVESPVSEPDMEDVDIGRADF